MQENKISILSTRLLPGSLTEKLQSAGINIDTISFIETEPIRSIEVQQEIEQALLQSTTVVFTSSNAVEAVISELDDQFPDWAIYCTHPATRKDLIKYFGEESIAGSAESAAELAQLIIEDGNTEEVIFFCGDRRKDVLPALLREQDITVHEIVVYQTTITPHKTTGNYHGIMFFSPTAVESFFKCNKLKEKTILFAIGASTANEISKYTSNKVITSDSPDKESLVNLVMDIFVDPES